MGFHKVAYLYCDGNGDGCETEGYEASSADMESATIAEYKKHMKKEGWIFKKGNKAYCPICRKDRQ
jgi:hypothetical protein